MKSYIRIAMLLNVVRYVGCVILKIVQLVSFLLSLPYQYQKQKQCPPIQNHILLLPATVLAEKIRKKELSSETLIKAYVDRMKAVNPVINAVVQDRYESAITDAQNVDKMLSTTSLTQEELQQQYPLLGLPLTIKESISVEGMSWQAGKIMPNGRIAKEDANVVRQAKKAGAIIVVVTNTPELCASFETVNNITGTTLNPYDTRRTPAASSGGEGALLGAGGSLIGVGSDLFGSIRLPAHYCGVWGHKPTARVVSVKGHYPCTADETLVEDTLSLGPMTRYGTDLRLLLDVIVKEEYKSQLQLDKHIPLNKSIRVYVVDFEDRSILTHPIDKDTLQCIHRFTSYMSYKYGCPVTKLQIKELKLYYEFALARLFSVEYDDIISDHRAYKEILKYFLGKSQSTFPCLLPGLAQNVIKQLPKSAIPSCNQAFDRLREKLAKIMGTEGILVFPCHPRPANYHRQFAGRIFDFSYTGIFNNLGFPATNCPMGMSSEGLPIGIQIIGSLLNDKLCLSVAEEIEKEFGGWIPPQFSKTIC